MTPDTPPSELDALFGASDKVDGTSASDLSVDLVGTTSERLANTEVDVSEVATSLVPKETVDDSLIICSGVVSVLESTCPVVDKVATSCSRLFVPKFSLLNRDGESVKLNLLLSDASIGYV